MTRYRAEWYEGGKWNAALTYDTMTAAECSLLMDYCGFPTRVVPVEASK